MQSQLHSDGSHWSKPSARVAHMHLEYSCTYSKEESTIYIQMLHRVACVLGAVHKLPRHAPLPPPRLQFARFSRFQFSFEGSILPIHNKRQHPATQVLRCCQTYFSYFESVRIELLKENWIVLKRANYNCGGGSGAWRGSLWTAPYAKPQKNRSPIVRCLAYYCYPWQKINILNFCRVLISDNFFLFRHKGQGVCNTSQHLNVDSSSVVGKLKNTAVLYVRVSYVYNTCILRYIYEIQNMT